MDNLRELIYDLDSYRKIMVCFSLPIKYSCWECGKSNEYLEQDKARGNRLEIEELDCTARKVGVSFWRNFCYHYKYPEKEKYEDRVVPVITSWNIEAPSGYIILCPNKHTWLGESDSRFFWQSSGGGSDYMQFSQSHNLELIRLLSQIKRDIENIIKNEPNFEEIEVKRES